MYGMSLYEDGMKNIPQYRSILLISLEKLIRVIRIQHLKFFSSIKLYNEGCLSHTHEID